MKVSKDDDGGSLWGANSIFLKPDSPGLSWTVPDWSRTVLDCPGLSGFKKKRIHPQGRLETAIRWLKGEVQMTWDKCYFMILF